MKTSKLGSAALALFLCLAADRTISADEPRMEVLRNQDVSGKVFKRFGLPNQNYCHQRCLEEDRCKAVRWGFMEGATAGQCQLLTGELELSEPKEIKTDDGQRIVVVVSVRKGS